MTLPMFAAWRHATTRTGFEVVTIARRSDGGHSFTGSSCGILDGEPWIATYELDVDARWHTRRARVRGRTGTVELAGDGAGGWTLAGAPAPQLAGLVDVDLEGSALTNAFPVARLRLAIGAGAAAPAIWVRAVDVRVERLEQHYVRTAELEYDYESPGFAAHLRYDADGLVSDYPGIAERAA